MQIVKQFKDFGISPHPPKLEGARIPIKDILNEKITILWHEINDSKYTKEDCLYLQIIRNGAKHVVFTVSKALIIDIQKIPKDGFPFTVTIIKEDRRFLFT